MKERRNPVSQVGLGPFWGLLLGALVVSVWYQVVIRPDPAVAHLAQVYEDTLKEQTSSLESLVQNVRRTQSLIQDRMLALVEAQENGVKQLVAMADLLADVQDRIDLLQGEVCIEGKGNMTPFEDGAAVEP